MLSLQHEVAGLTRPMRLLRRPHVGVLPHLVTRRWAAVAATKKTQETSPKRQKDEANDFLIAQDIAREEGRSGRRGKAFLTGKKPSKLPSLMEGQSLRKTRAERLGLQEELDGVLPATPQEEPVKSIPANAEAGPSNVPSPIPPIPSRKGKEKAIETAQPASEAIRCNPVGVQMLSSALHAQLFPGPALPQPPESLLKTSREHLESHGLSPEGAAIMPEISFEMPSLRGDNIRQHFHSLGHETGEPYLTMAKAFCDSDLPSQPTYWETSRPGWTKYYPDGRAEAVPALDDETLVSFDVETLYKLSPFPVMATAATPNAWYSWLSPTLFQDSPGSTPHRPPPWEKKYPSHHPHDLIPLFPQNGKERIVIGHNVGYDRARVKEEYDLVRTSTRYIDTLSLHAATRGITSVQRPAWIKHKKNKVEKLLRDAELLEILQEEADIDEDSLLAESIQSASGDVETALENRWEDVTSLNSLAEVAALHCGYPVDKTIRNRFGDEDITHASQLRPELQELIAYCANDVRVTHDVYKKVLPLFLQSCPHPATFAGVLAMGSSFLPVDESWEKYLKAAEEKYVEMNENVKKSLRILADNLRLEGPRDDPWSSQLDWSPKAARWPEGGPGAIASECSSTSNPSARDAGPMTSEDNSPNVNDGSNDVPQPAWYRPLAESRSNISSNSAQRTLVPLILRMSYKGHPVVYLSESYWCFAVPHEAIPDYVDTYGAPRDPSSKDGRLNGMLEEYAFFPIARPNEARPVKLTGQRWKKAIKCGDLTSPYPDLLMKAASSDLDLLEDELWDCAHDMRTKGQDTPWGQQLDWSTSKSTRSGAINPPTATSPPVKKAKNDFGLWPKWYWDLTTAPTNDKVPFGELDLTVKKTVAPLLLRLQWQGHSLVHSREHKWLYRVPKDAAKDMKSASGAKVTFGNVKGDEALKGDTEHIYFRLPHKDGEGKNVGNPLSKSFVKSIESGELSSLTAGGDDATAQAARDATNLNALCSYWISSRERIMDQMVVYQDEHRRQGMILPQVITMGTVTRRAVEATWLTASNAKKNRVGSELKAMVRAPPGYAIVGADVDSEELWISSVMGDSQFGMHGATAIGWMTLEGTKSAGTDLHSKTASILGISRDAAKVFNYSRIYGAGAKHAVQLLRQGDPNLSKEAAQKLAQDLYKSTKGAKSTRSDKKPPAEKHSLWHGGSESYLFNTLEAIASSDRPTTPALGCGVTRALRKSYLEESSAYLPSRINWVVQSSGVDYLHLLIVSMEYLLKTYSISARYLISVHDEVRYLAKEEDRYRCALALQIANAWTRALFCYNLGIDDMPQGIAFFSAVDVDFLLRKEVDMTCETPSHPSPLAKGESLDILKVLEKTGGSLGTALASTAPGSDKVVQDAGPPVVLFPDLASADHRKFLFAQSSSKHYFAKRWLDSQKPLLDAEGHDLPAREVLAEKEEEAKAKVQGKAPRRARKKRAISAGAQRLEFEDEHVSPAEVDRYEEGSWDEVDFEAARPLAATG